MDDTPPFMIDEEALDIALSIGLLYDCIMVDELHIARKQYLDGSIPTGFQRTTIVGVDGKVPYKDRSIRIIQLGLEEDACREVSDVGHRRTYLTDRLGMPLIETVTAPDMRTPQEVAEVGQLLRRIVRSTAKVRTGIGAAREDVNVSVTGGTRVEIKGVPRLPRIPLLTYNEAMRQWNLLRLRAALERCGITTKSFSATIEDVTKHVRKTLYQPIQSALGQGVMVFGVKLVGFKGFLRWQTQTDTYFHQEISDRVRVIACLTALPNILHSDSPGEGLSSAEWQAVRKALGARDEDAVVLVWGQDADARLAAQEIVIRAKEATIGIPSETRQALKDGTNGFERILPGPDRMYPDTDLPPKRVTAERLAGLGAALPPRIVDRERRYAALGVPADLVFPLAGSRFAGVFEKMINGDGLSPKLAALVLAQYPKRLMRKGLPAERLEERTMSAVLEAVRSGRLFKEGILPILVSVLETGKSVEDLLPPAGKKKDFRKDIGPILASVADEKFTADASRARRAMGLLMEAWRGRVDGAAAAADIEARLSGGAR
jgi:glutamyl-tRNA(Gln) amidotransferase subunit E